MLSWAKKSPRPVSQTARVNVSSDSTTPRSAQKGVLDLPAGAILLKRKVTMFIAYLLKDDRVIYVGTVQLGQSIIYLKENAK